MANAPLLGVDPLGEDFVDLWVKPVGQVNLGEFGGLVQTKYCHYLLVVGQCANFTNIDGYFSGAGGFPAGHLVVRIQPGLDSETSMNKASERGGQVVNNLTTDKETVRAVLREATRLQAELSAKHQPYFLGMNVGFIHNSNSAVATILKRAGVSYSPSSLCENVGF